MEEGKSISVAPVRLLWKPASLKCSYPAQIAFAVSKKKFSLAVDRNRIKRQMREVYRKNKTHLYALLTERNMQASLMLMFTGKEMPTYTELEKKFSLILIQLEEHL